MHIQQQQKQKERKEHNTNAPALPPKCQHSNFWVWLRPAAVLIFSLYLSEEAKAETRRELVFMVMVLFFLFLVIPHSLNRFSVWYLVVSNWLVARGREKCRSIEGSTIVKDGE